MLWVLHLHEVDAKHFLYLLAKGVQVVRNHILLWFQELIKVLRRVSFNARFVELTLLNEAVANLLEIT